MTRPDETLLRRAFALARAALERGDMPFGAIVATADGKVLSEAGSTQASQRDATAHAMMNALRRAMTSASRTEIAQPRRSITSAEPCVMCTAALFYAGVGRVVFGAIAGQDPLGRTAGGTGLPASPCHAGQSWRGRLDGSKSSGRIWRMRLCGSSSTPAHERAPCGRGATAARHRDRSPGWRNVASFPSARCIVGRDGQAIAEACSTEVSTRDWTGHAEMNAIRMACGTASRGDLAASNALCIERMLRDVRGSGVPCGRAAHRVRFSRGVVAQAPGGRRCDDRARLFVPRDPRDRTGAGRDPWSLSGGRGRAGAFPLLESDLGHAAVGAALRRQPAFPAGERRLQAPGSLRTPHATHPLDIACARLLADRRACPINPRPHRLHPRDRRLADVRGRQGRVLRKPPASTSSSVSSSRVPR